MLLRRCFRVGMITRPEESYWLWCVLEWPWSLVIRRPWPTTANAQGGGGGIIQVHIWLQREDGLLLMTVFMSAVSTQKNNQVIHFSATFALIFIVHNDSAIRYCIQCSWNIIKIKAVGFVWTCCLSLLTWRRTERISLQLQKLSTNYTASHPRRPYLHIHSTEHLTSYTSAFSSLTL
jgi:hypothetical protein